MDCDCLFCKYTEVVRDNHDNTHTICVCEESENFLKPVSIVWGKCDEGEKETDEEETEADDESEST